MRRAAWTLLCLGLLSAEGVFCQQLCVSPQTTSQGTTNFARACGSGASNCVASQSSFLPSGFGSPPSIAVDGGTGAFFHTNYNANEWWSVDFGVSRKLSRVIIINRETTLSSIAQRLDGASIRVGDGSTFDSVLNTQCALTPSGSGGTVTVNCNAVGRYLFVVRSECIHFEELSAFGPCACPSGQYGPITGIGACVVCSTGTTSPQGSIGSASCVMPCPSNAQRPPDGSACECNAGYTSLPASCAACVAGTYKSVTGSAGCASCPSGQTSQSASRTFSFYLTSQVHVLSPQGLTLIAWYRLASDLNNNQNTATPLTNIAGAPAATFSTGMLDPGHSSTYPCRQGLLGVDVGQNRVLHI